MMNMNIKPSAMGYGIKSGRLVNNAPSPKMGITKMVEMKKAVKRAEKIQKYAEAVRLGNMS